MTAAAVAPPPVDAPAGTRPRARRRRRALVVLGIVFLVVTGFRVHDRIQQDEARQPLVAAERASHAEQSPVGVLSPARAERWTADGPGPAEDQVRAIARPGNVYLAPAFHCLFGRHGGPPAVVQPADSRCYYFPVQQGADFDAARVSAVVRICYVDGSVRPQGWASTVVD